jgi:hypothetical protein
MLGCNGIRSDNAQQGVEACRFRQGAMAVHEVSVADLVASRQRE